jgi:amidohydrolase
MSENGVTNESDVTRENSGAPAGTMLDLAEKWLAEHCDDLIRWRRQLHAHPEVAFGEHRTTDMIIEALRGGGLQPQRLSVGTGVVCDIGPGPVYVALRADIDALPLPDGKAVPYASQNPGICHACGHDAHTAILLGVAALLAQKAALAQPETSLVGSVRLIFQPAEELMPGGAVVVVHEGALDGVSEIFALHCDPKLDVGLVGLRAGDITAAFHQIQIHVTGAGGHTARPHLTSDLVFALGKLITELPGLLSRRIDPRSALSLVWGSVNAGSAPNSIPQIGSLSGTLRMLDGELWHGLEDIVRELVHEIIAPTGAGVHIEYDRGLPAVSNDAVLVALQRRAAARSLGVHSATDTAQSMGGEDFAWYLQSVPGAMARLGVRRPDSGDGGDLHQSNFDIDEDALAAGVRFTAAILDELWAVTRR